MGAIFQYVFAGEKNRALFSCVVLILEPTVAYAILIDFYDLLKCLTKKSSNTSHICLHVFTDLRKSRRK